MPAEQGLLHICYGNGAGKTTAAFGLAFRSAGWGRRVVAAQFLKGGESGEVRAAERCPEITVLRSHAPMKFTFQMNEEERAAAAADCAALFEKAAALAAEQGAGLLVLDEVIDTLGVFLPPERLLRYLDEEKPAGLEVVLTGHSLPPELAARADYITRMACEKHPYDRGVTARKGVEF